MVTINLLKGLKKFCPKCNRWLCIWNFHLQAIRKDGLYPFCKECVSGIMVTYWEDHKEEKLEYDKIYRAVNKDKHNASNKLWREEHSEERQEYHDARKPQKKAYRDSHKEERKAWLLANKDKLAEQANARDKKKREEDPAYWLVCRLRTRINEVLKGLTKSGHSLDLLGSDGDFAMGELGKLFWPGMIKDKRNWQVDHIVPISHFNVIDPEEQRIAFHYSNLQPLWGDDNRIKLDSLDWNPSKSKHELPSWYLNDPTSYQARVDFVLDKLSKVRLKKAA